MPIALALHDIQGNILRAYRSEAKARFLFLRIAQPAAGRKFIKQLRPCITPAAWGENRPAATTNIALSCAGLSALGLPAESTSSFPLDFRQGMRARAAALGDAGESAPERWDEPWRNPEAQVHLLVSCYSTDAGKLDHHCRDLLARLPDGVAELGPHQDASRIVTGGQAIEHFGFADGLSNPAIEGMPHNDNRNLVGNPDGKGGFSDIPAGEFVLGYPGVGDEQRDLPVPGLLGVNGTFLVFRKLAQDVAGFRAYLDSQCQILSHLSSEHDRAFLAAKLVGRWRDGSPLVRYPRSPATADPTNQFDYIDDPEGALCPLGAHVRRSNPRSSLGLDGQLSKRRRMIRRSIAYGDFVPEEKTPDNRPRGIIFLAYMSGIERQFEFVQQQWINIGDSFRQGNDKDPLVGNNDGSGRMVVPGDERAGRPPFLCTGLPRFVTVKGGAYFFVPGLTALHLLAEGRFQQN
jgi:Dyp-type peroxidase family